MVEDSWYVLYSNAPLMRESIGLKVWMQHIDPPHTWCEIFRLNLRGVWDSNSWLLVTLTSDTMLINQFNKKFKLMVETLKYVIYSNIYNIYSIRYFIFIPMSLVQRCTLIILPEFYLFTRNNCSYIFLNILVNICKLLLLN